MSDTSQQDIGSGYAQPSRKYSIEILAKIERKKKKNRILAPKVLIQAKKIQNFTCAHLKVVFSFFHLQLF
jgi:hypothetical protein